MALPNFLGIGAEKAGTTPLCRLLMQHPEIFITPDKETHFFSRGDYLADLRFYEAAFFHRYAGEPAIGEMTPDYMRLPGNARRLREALGRIKIIICLREPLRRAFSHYHQCLRLLEDNRSFFTACEQELAAPPDFMDYLAARQAYVHGSLYSAQIAEFAREFGSENLFFMILERDLATNQAKREMLERLFRFLEVDPRPQAPIVLVVRDTSLPCPTLELVTAGAARTVLDREGREVAVLPGDIVLRTGNRGLDRVIRRPSAHMRRFFSGMAENMTRTLSREESERLRNRYFSGVTAETSEIVGCDLAAFWSSADPHDPL